MSLFFSSKAAGLMKNRRPFIKLLTNVYIVGVATMIGLGIWVGILNIKSIIDSENMCIAWQFYAYDICSVIIIALFIGAYCKIKHRIKEMPEDSSERDRLMIEF